PESSPPAERSDVVIREDPAPPVTPPHQNGQRASTATAKGGAPPPRVDGAGKAEEPRKTAGEHRARRGPRWSWLGTATVVAALAALTVALLVRPATGPENEPPVRGSPETTTDPARIVMPDLRGMPYEEALSLLEGQDLLVRTVEVQGDPGVVVATDPSLGQVIPPGTRVTLYVGR
ncbi:MAG TPA: PASTA domain-containing protein, partial [Gemmatimonadota bacterium]|nr:PASTA domain-containing protein [Gemmatimonadota bacterium]